MEKEKKAHALKFAKRTQWASYDLWVYGKV